MSFHSCGMTSSGVPWDWEQGRRENGAQLVPGEHVRVTDVHGLELTVE